MKKMKTILTSLKEASEEFLTADNYDFYEEFRHRRQFSGTRMPLTFNCYRLDVYTYFQTGRSLYASKELVIRGEYELTNLGKIKLKFLKTLDVELERSTMGTIACWLLRKNERKRQVEAIKSRSKNLDWIVLRDGYEEYRSEVMQEIYFYILDSCISYMEKELKEKQWDEYRDHLRKYISEQNKKDISMVASHYDRYTYKEFLELDSYRSSLTYMIKVLKLVRDNFYSALRLNPKFMLTALRNRPFDIWNMGETKANGSMDRSREALGQPPFSLLWMFCHKIKQEVLTEALNRIEKLYKIDFIDPIRDRDFYYKLTQKEPGLYVFGDNGLLMGKDGIIGVYDLSISDVFQGYLRRQDKNNFCFFVRLNGEYDCGSTGDALTTIWNIEGQIYIWRKFLDGYLSSKKEWPEITDLCEHANTFLGHYYCESIKDWMTIGVRLTKDDAKKAIPVSFKRGQINHFAWSPKKSILRNEFLALCISSGMIDMKLTKFYEWCRLKKILLFDEEIGMQGRINEATKIPGFLDLSEANIDNLAEPYKLGGPLILENIEKEV